ncbi:hypothetical protein BX604_4449 [Burkholderia sp. JKS000303]|nr:hypothetical protein BX604_4449 [Burkholderia sp. JKS000303]
MKTKLAPVPTNTAGPQYHGSSYGYPVSGYHAMLPSELCSICQDPSL